MSTYQIIAGHGRTEAECLALRVLDQQDREWMSAAGLTMMVSHDFAALKAENEALRETGWAPLVPIYDEAFERIDASNGAWICARDAQGALVGVSVARLREVDDLRQRLEDGSFLLGASPPEGARFRARLTGIDGISGPVVFIGGLFVPPSRRGSRLSIVLGAALMRYCWYRWSTVLVVAFMAPSEVYFGLWGHAFNAVAGKVWFKDPRWSGKPKYNVLTVSQTEIRREFLGLGRAPAQLAAAAPEGALT